MISIDRIREASRIVDAVFRNSPQFEYDALNDELGFRLVLKVECLNPIRSFKGRGTDYLYHLLGDHSDPLVSASAGNFGQGMAYAARKRQRRVTIFAAHNANQLKVARMQALGAEVRLSGQDFDAAKEAARHFAGVHGLRFIEDGREIAISEGAGTIAVEMIEAGVALDEVLIPVGNGALISGLGTWFKAFSPLTKMNGIVARGAPSMMSSWVADRVIETESADTIADGIAVRSPIPDALREMRQVVDKMTAVDDARILEAVQLGRRHLGLTLEPAGAAGLAAALELRGQLAGKVVATILCGSNVDPAVLIPGTKT